MKGMGVNPDSSGTAPPVVAYSKKMDYDGSGNLIYTGWAKSVSGLATSAAVWAIQKNTFDGSNQQTDIQWADGNTNEDNIWDNRASLTYA